MTGDSFSGNGESLDGSRDFVRYAFWFLRPEWRRLPPNEKDASLLAFERILKDRPADLELRSYSLVGTKAGVHGLLWMISPRLEAFQELEARLWGSLVGAYVELPYAYLGVTRKSEYLRDHRHAGAKRRVTRPLHRNYLFVYPLVKQREWYALPFEERRRIMGEHFRIGHRFPGIRIHTGYSFGLDDAEFILAFEGDSPSEFLDLVNALRPSEASRYTAVETPIFTCIETSPRRMLDLAAGLP